MTRPRRPQHRRLLFLAGTFVLLLAGAIVVGKWMHKRYPNDDDPPIPTAVLSPMGPAGKRQWSKEVVHFPGYPIYEGRREWSHWEIAQRHKASVLNELPEYITDLRGGGRIEETHRTTAGWYGVIPMEKMTEFRQYMLDLGVPEEALLEERRIPFPEEYQVSPDSVEPSASPPKRMLFGTSLKSIGETEIMGMKFGKSNGTMTYYLANPDRRLPGARIKVAWLTGNVQFLQNAIDPED